MKGNMPAEATPTDPKIVNASPTKEFFIYMLTRDVPLARSVLDLVDNSVDGAKRMRATASFSGLWVRVELDGQHFRIADNCGGIPVDIARNYAFRFGRPPNAPATTGSVGNFGVGMKRTFFKLGRRFTVESVTSSSRFDMNVLVDEWVSSDDSNDPARWHFKFDNVDENLTEVSPETVGTRIEVTGLHQSVAENFALENFLTGLKDDIRSAHTLSMDQGLAISVNGVPLNHEPQRLFTSAILKPAFVERVYATEALGAPSGPAVKVKLYAGIAERSFHEGGWYVFCNGRLVIQADKTPTSIWGPIHDMRQYHPDFAYFRGYAYFDSDNASLLPWTTTKTGVDVDSPLYRSVRQEMIEISKPVLTFLTNLAKEKSAFETGESEHNKLQEAVRTSQAAPAGSITVATSFLSPPPDPVPTGPRWQRIQYNKPLPQVTKAMKLLKVSTFKQVGEKTFDYYLQYEGED